MQIKKDTSEVEEGVARINALSGCEQTNGHICIGLLLSIAVLISLTYVNDVSVHLCELLLFIIVNIICIIKVKFSSLLNRIIDYFLPFSSSAVTVNIYERSDNSFESHSTDYSTTSTNPIEHSNHYKTCTQKFDIFVKSGTLCRIHY